MDHRIKEWTIGSKSGTYKQRKFTGPKEGCKGEQGTKHENKRLKGDHRTRKKIIIGPNNGPYVGQKGDHLRPKGVTI